MVTACLFPGLNSITRLADRKRYASLQPVQDNLLALKPWGYDKWFDQPDELLFQRDNYSAIAALTLAIQEGVYRDLCRRGLKPNILIGCSLGDLSRSVCSGAINFEKALELIPRFGDLAKHSTSKGVTLSVKLAYGQTIGTGMLRQLHDADLDVSVLSDRYFIVGCDGPGAQRLKYIANHFNWTVIESPFDFPLHSRHLKVDARRLKRIFNVAARDPDIPVYSAVQLKPLSTANELARDAVRCFYSPVRWVEALSKLKHNFGVSRFINIGPCRSLNLLIRDTDIDLVIEEAASYGRNCAWR